MTAVFLLCRVHLELMLRSIVIRIVIATFFSIKLIFWRANSSIVLVFTDELMTNNFTPIFFILCLQAELPLIICSD